MKRNSLIGLLAIAVFASQASAGSKQSVSVNVRPAAAATVTCSCTTAGAPGMNGQYNRRASTPYGTHWFQWSSNGASVVVKDEGGNTVSTAKSGLLSRGYDYGYIYWSVSCVSTPNEVGETATGSCSDYTFLSCFPAGTQITMIDAAGNMFYKNIEDVKVGETVLSWDPATGQFVPSVVTQPIKTTSNAMFEMVDSAGNTLKITPTHKMYIKGKGFVSSEDVKVGDILITAPDGIETAVTSVKLIEGPVDVYNLITDVPHDFFAQNILVHNVDDASHKNHGFVAGTMIQTMRGPVPIEQIKVGDKLIAVDPATGLMKLNPVLQTGTQRVTKTVSINGMRMGTAQPLFLGKKLAKKPAIKK